MPDEERQRLIFEIEALEAERAALEAVPEPLIPIDLEGQSAWKLLRVEQSLKAKQARLQALQAAEQDSTQS